MPNSELEQAEATAVELPTSPLSGRKGMAGRVLWLAWPAVMEQTLNMTVGLVDTYLVGHLGASQLAAVGLGIQVVAIISVLIAAIAVGSTALVARHVGAGEPEMANRVLQQSLLIALLIGAVCTIIGVALAEPIIRLFGAEQEVVGYGATYLRIASITLILTAALFVGNACLRGAGDTRTPLAVMIMVNLLNIGIAYTLINGVAGLPRMGVAGSALGAAISRGLGGLAILAVVWGRHRLLRLRGRRWSWDPAQVRRILNIGLPSGLEQALLYIAQIAFAAVIARLGTAAFAAFEVSINISSLSFMPGFGFSLAATTLVGQYLGAGQPDNSEQSGYTAFYLGLGTMLVMALVLLVFAEPISRAFISDESVIPLAAQSVRVAALAQPSLAAAMVFAGALRGAGDTRGVMLAMGTSIWLVRVPIGLLLTLVGGWGVAGVYAAQGADFTVRGVWLWLRFRRNRWKEIVV